MPPDEQRFHDDLNKPLFRRGEARGCWRILNIKWPLVIAVVASQRSGKEYTVRFSCAGYPTIPATAAFWDQEHDCDLPYAAYPKPSPDNERMAWAMRRPRPGLTGFYLACDREWIGEGREKRNDWPQKHPEETWCSELGIVSYLRVLRDVLD